MRFLSVMISQQKAGRLIAMERGKIGFQYEPSWLESGFSLSLPTPRDSATQPTVILPTIPRSFCRVSRSEATQGF